MSPPLSPDDAGGNSFAPALQHRGPDDVACEILSCPRPAESVLLLRGQHRTRCVLHASELRRQGATLTDLDPGFDRVTKPPPPHPETPMSIDAPETLACSWPGCTNPRAKRLFCLTCQGRAYKLTGSTIVEPADIQHLAERWAARAHVETEPAPSPSPAADLRGGVFDTMLRTALGLAIDAEGTEVVNHVAQLVEAARQSDVWHRKYERTLDEVNEAHRSLACATGEIQNLRDERDLARERLAVARNALLLDEYFKPEDVGDDLAPRIIERLASIKRWADQVGANNLNLLNTLAKPRPLTEEDLDRRIAALTESRRLRAIALGEVSDV